MAILTEYSLWLSFICILVGVLYSVLLYYKNRDIDFGKNNLKILYTIRGFSITLIAFLLLVPLTKMIIKKSEKPILIFALDNSESIVSSSDSSYYKNEFPKQYGDLIAKFGHKYEVILYEFGNSAKKVNQPSYNFTDKNSQISDLIEELKTLYVNRNIGALIIASDGIINKGGNPLYALQYSKFPVYTIGMGNPETQTDLYVANIVHNSQTYKGNSFPVEIKIGANHLKGKTAKLKVFQGDKEVYSTSISIPSQSYYTSISTLFEAKSIGIQKYKIVLSDLDGEVTYKNNSATFYIEVVDQREKVAIIYHAPHPDISAIKSALEVSDKYQIELFSSENFKGSLNAYSLVILHQIPSIQFPAPALMNEIQNSKVSVLYILGPKTNFNIFNTHKKGISILKNKDLSNESSPVFNQNFISFTFSEEAKQMLLKLPPLQTPFGDYNETVGAQVFLYQKIAGVNTNFPLILFHEGVGAKSGVIVASGIWQWKLYNYLYANNNDVFNEIINKTAQYLSVFGDKSFFRIKSKHLYNENEQIDFQAELYNESYELINNSDVHMEIQSSSGKKYPFQFSKKDLHYYLSIGELPSDDYKWTATTLTGNQKFSKSGAFTVKEIMVESQNLVANHQLLKSIANDTKGSFYPIQKMNNIEKDIKSNENIKSIATYNKSYNMFLNSIIYFILIILLLSVEWFIRKWNGGY